MSPAMTERAVREMMGESRDLIDRTLAICSARIVEAANLIERALSAEHTVFFAGNGGSASQALHLSAELVGRFKVERRPFPSIALVENVSTITAIANDYVYDEVFARQVCAFGRAGDVLVALSTSGTSRNVLRAADEASGLGMEVIALTGATGGELVERAQVLIAVPGTDVAHVQEVHLVIGHLLCSVADDLVPDR